MRKFASAILLLFTLSVSGQTNILHTASFWNAKPDLEIIKREIGKGNSPSAAGPYGADATVYAINAQSSMPILEYMLALPGNEVNKIVSNGRTYIFSAASKGNLPLMTYLIEKGAKMDVKDNFGYTVLTYAAATAQTDLKVYDFCIQHGSSPKNEKIVGGANALMLLAPYDQNFSIISYFMNKGVPLKAVDSSGLSAFDYAINGGNIEVLKKLFNKGVSSKPGALLNAAIGLRDGPAPSLQLFEYLEGLKFDPRVTDQNGNGLLHYLVRRPGQQNVIAHFLARGLQINQANNEGTTPLMNAASSNVDQACIALFLKAGANINAVNKRGISALALALKNNTALVVKMLLENGANISVKDLDGYNLGYYLMMSFNQGSPDFEEKMKLLEQKTFDFKVPQSNGNTLYHIALLKNNLELMQKISRFKIDVNEKNKEGLTVLHKAAMIAEHDQLLKYLISIGAHKELKTNYNETAFDLAKENELLTKQKISIDFLK